MGAYIWFPIEASISSCWIIYLSELQKLQQASHKLPPRLIAISTWLMINGLSILVLTHLSLQQHLYTVIVILLLCQLIYAIGALENISRNLLRFSYWHCKPLIIGLFTLFVFNLVTYTFALLLKGFYELLWQIKPLIISIALLLVFKAHNRDLYTAIVRYSHTPNLVFNSTLIIICAFLIVTALAGQISFSFSTLNTDFLSVFTISIVTTSILAIFFSRQVKSFVREHLLAQKYDYRSLWHEFNQFIYHEDDNINHYERASLAIGSLFDVKHTALWYRRDKQDLQLCCNLLSQPDQKGLDQLKDRLIDYFAEHPVYIFKQHEKNLLNNVTNNFWLAAPLYKELELQGILILENPPLLSEYNDEDQQLLEQACEQANYYLLQHQSDEELSELHLFDTYHQATAYIVHDLKTLQSQFSLLEKNAEKHKNKPSFIDDAIITIKHANQKIASLLERAQTRNLPSRTKINVADSIKKAVLQRKNYKPIPQYSYQQDSYCLGDADELETVLINLIKNAQEACASQDKIKIQLQQHSDKIEIDIQDTGVGMSERYLQEKLFKPFQSTKGVNGMGVGLYQCHKIIQSMAGHIQVSSKQNEGTTFSIFLPNL